MQKSLGSVLLREWRGERRQIDAAAALGLDQASYSKYERGERRPGIPIALQIADRTEGRVPVPSWAEDVADQDKQAA